MFDRNTHYVIQEKRDGKYIAYSRTIGNSNNLVSIFENPSIVSVNAADTLKEAREIADYWNKCYKKDGTYLYV